MTDWDTDKSGNIIAQPLTLFQVAPFPDYEKVLVRLEIAKNETEVEGVQIAMPTDMAARLARDLRRAADEIEKATKRATKMAKKQ